MSRLRPWFLLPVLAAITLPLMPLQQLLVWFSPGLARRFPKLYHRIVCRILGVRVERVGTPATTGPVLMVSNHVSWLDIVVLSSTAPVSFVAKKEVGSWPLFGSLARLQRTVFVDRKRRSATGTSSAELRQRLTAGDAIVLFAEGTSSDGRRVLPFKSAFLGAAHGANVPIQPVTLAYRGHRNLPMNRRLLPFYAWYGDMDLAPHLLGVLRSGPIEVSVIYHPPLPTGVDSDRKVLARKAEDRVRRGLAEALHHPGKIR